METLKLSDFAKSRGVNRDTITQYIRRNKEQFEGHTKVDGKWMELDQVAEELLDKKYPLPHPVEIVEDTESRRQLILAQQRIIQLQQELAAAKDTIALTTKNEFLLEQKEKEVKEQKKQLETQQNDLEKIRQEKQLLELKKNTVENELKFVKDENERLKNRGLFARILNN